MSISRVCKLSLHQFLINGTIETIKISKQIQYVPARDTDRAMNIYTNPEAAIIFRNIQIVTIRIAQGVRQQQQQEIGGC